MSKKNLSSQALNSIISRAHYTANRMVFEANQDKGAKGDPKVGGHSSTNCSSIHLLGALHLMVRSGYDFICNKPHSSPGDHSYNYLLDLFFTDPELNEKLTDKQAQGALTCLRKFKSESRPFVFQSYHSIYDSDHFNYLPSGTVGIPPVNIGYLALAYKMLTTLPKASFPKEAHFWAIMGDAEFREGSLLEAMPDFSERGLDNLTWIIDYNRQGLDGHRITSNPASWKTDADRIEKTALANGWDVISLKHGSLREKAFKSDQGESFKNFLENELTDYEFQTLLLTKDAKTLHDFCIKKYPAVKDFISKQKPEDFKKLIRDTGGHDFDKIVKALEKSKDKNHRPTLIICHTIKGWGLEMEAQPSNHSALISKKEVESIKSELQLKNDFERFNSSSEEGKFLKQRGTEILSQMKDQLKMKEKNASFFAKLTQDIPDSLEVNFKIASYPHTQWMLGQLTAKLNRIALTQSKDLSELENRLKKASELLVTMAPDVGTSTNLNNNMDGHIYGFEIQDQESDLNVKEKKAPDLVPSTSWDNRFLRFDITEANTTSCLGSIGKIKNYLGIPLVPLMTIYDFFIKRALDQHFYNLYWKSSFILMGTPSGVTLSYEGAQHGWKSDLQIPNQITWEPFFCQELDWIFCETLKSHFKNEDEKKSGVHIRCVTKGVDQKVFLKRLQTQLRFKQNPQTLLAPTNLNHDGAQAQDTVPAMDEPSILPTVRDEVLKGGYKLVCFEGYADYRPGDNVVNIFAMGALVDEALKASDELLEKGIYANVIVVTSPDLLLTETVESHGYAHLKNLNAHNEVFFHKVSDINKDMLAGRCVPVVSVHDGELGLLDNIGSLLGARQKALGVVKHSVCGSPAEVYAHHGIDCQSIKTAALEALHEVAEQATVWP